MENIGNFVYYLEVISRKFLHKMEKYVSGYCIRNFENNKKVGKKFPDMKLLFFCFKGSFHRKACNTASFSRFLPFPAARRK